MGDCFQGEIFMLTKSRDTYKILILFVTCALSSDGLRFGSLREGMHRPETPVTIWAFEPKEGTGQVSLFNAGRFRTFRIPGILVAVTVTSLPVSE